MNGNRDPAAGDEASLDRTTWGADNRAPSGDLNREAVVTGAGTSGPQWRRGQRAGLSAPYHS
jgi:hypothetical protein